MRCTPRFELKYGTPCPPKVAFATFPTLVAQEDVTIVISMSHLAEVEDGEDDGDEADGPQRNDNPHWKHGGVDPNTIMEREGARKENEQDARQRPTT